MSPSFSGISGIDLVLSPALTSLSPAVPTRAPQTTSSINQPCLDQRIKQYILLSIGGPRDSGLPGTPTLRNPICRSNCTGEKPSFMGKRGQTRRGTCSELVPSPRRRELLGCNTRVAKPSFVGVCGDVGTCTRTRPPFHAEDGDANGNRLP